MEEGCTGNMIYSIHVSFFLLSHENDCFNKQCPAAKRKHEFYNGTRQIIGLVVCFGQLQVLQQILPNLYLLHMQTSSVEIERVCNRADECLLETAAVSIKPSGGGPEHLAILAVLKDRSAQYDVNLLKRKFQTAIQKNLNPLFKVCIRPSSPFCPPLTSNDLTNMCTTGTIN